MAGITTGSDGSIRIDTRLDTEGFNQGTRKLEKSTDSLGKRILSRFKSIGKGIVAVFKTALGIVMGIIGLISVGILFGNDLMDKLTRGIDKTSKYSALINEMKSAFDLLKGSMLSVFATLLQAAMPTLIKVINWLTTMLEKLNMIIAAWTGQKTVMRAVIKGTQEQKKAVEGSLAAFDQISVLQKKDEAEAAADPNPITFEEVPVTQEALDLVNDVKTAWSDTMTTLNQLWQDFLEFIHWDDISKAASDAWDFITKALGEAWTNIVAIWNALGLGQMFNDLWLNAKETFRKLLINALETFLGIRDGIQRVFKGITEIIEGIIQGDWKKIWQGLKDVVGGVLDTISAIVVGVLNHFGILFLGWIEDIRIILGTLEQIFIKVFEAINKVAMAFAKGITNLVIEAVNAMIRALVGGINHVINALNSISIDIPEWIPIFGGQTWEMNLRTISAPQIPRLATGAVIPPNAEFAAILGDQRNGRNLETPEALLQQMLDKAVESSNGQAITVTMPVYLDGQLIYQNQKRIERRRGTSLITGGTTA